MGKRTAAEVLAEKLTEALSETAVSAMESWASYNHIQRAAARLAEDPAITVRTDMVVERFVVERHYAPPMGPRAAEVIRRALLSNELWFDERPEQYIIVRPYPEGEK